MMGQHKILVIGLDGYEPSVGDRLMAQGKLEHLRLLKEGSAHYRLDHGVEKYTGLAGEHFSSGQSPHISGRWTAVHFDPDRYEVEQRGTDLLPFVADLAAQSMVFDPTYFDLEKAPQTQGIVAWGSHDPGVSQHSRPSGLCAEITERFGPYKAADCIYGFTWPSVEKTVEVGTKLREAVDQRAQIARWLLCERLPNWELALLVVSEVHSVLEPMWHGLDPSHPLHHLPSAQPAAAAVEEVYQAVDRLIGSLMAALPDTTIVTFSMHGMGANEADVPSMLLLPELLYRFQFHDGVFTPLPEWTREPQKVVLLQEHEEWETVIRERLIHPSPRKRSSLGGVWRFLKRQLKKFPLTTETRPPTPQHEDFKLSVDWMPAAQYRRYWSKMKAFALPAYYDGRIRINLAGREKHGMVTLAEYDAFCGEIETLLKQCRDLRTGEPMVRAVERTAESHPFSLGHTEGDLIVRWQGAATGLRHPTIGIIGPAPYRRTGGHTGKHGMAYLYGKDIPPGDYGVASSFDVVPTLFELLQEKAPSHIAGKSLLSSIEQCHA